MSVLLSKLCRPAFGARFSRGMKSNLNSFSKRVVSKPAVTWKSLAVTGCVVGGMIYFFNNVRKEKAMQEAVQRKRQLGKAAIGGRFELLDSDRKLRTSEEFKGQWLLIYFGFTHCPDICPDEIEKMVKTVDYIDKDPDFPNVQPIFISVDPDRDTPEVVGKYIKEYSPKFIGLTGDKDQVDKVCKAYRVYYSAGPQDEDADYIVDHTIIIYLIDPDGEFVDYYGQTRNFEEVAAGIKLQMLKHEKMKENPAAAALTSSLKNIVGNVYEG